MVFNIIARNHDNQEKWQLAPAYDLAYSYKPGSPWVSSHWMKLNGKRDRFTREDFYSFKKISPIFTNRKIDHIIGEITEHVSQWNNLAIEHSIPKTLINLIASNLPLKI